MDQNIEKKVGCSNGKNNVQGADQLIKDISQITSIGGKKQNNWYNNSNISMMKNVLNHYSIKQTSKGSNQKIQIGQQSNEGENSNLLFTCYILQIFNYVLLKNNVVKKNEVEDSNQKQRIQKIQDQGQQWTKKILIELERQDLLKKEIEEVLKNMKAKNLKVGGGSLQIGEQISEQEQIAQQKRQNQQKLDKLKAKNNQMVAQIQRLKEEVKVSRNERAFFDNVFKNLERDMKQKEEQIKQFVLDNTLNGYEYKKQEEVSVMISKLLEKEQILFKTAYESQMLSKPNDVYNIDELCQSIVLENQKIKETEEEEDDEEEENNLVTTKHDLNQTQNQGKIQEMKYENFLKLKKDFISKMKNDKVDYDNKCESIKKLLLMTNSESIEQFKQDFGNIDDQVEGLYQQSEFLNQEISSLRKQVSEVDSEINSYSEKKENLIRQMDSNRQVISEKDKLIRDIQSIESTQKNIRENNTQIENDLQKLCQLIPPMLRELNVISDEFLRENIHMNIHPNNVLDFFGTIEKKATLTNMIFNRLQELQQANPNKRRGKKKNTYVAGMGNNMNGNNNNAQKLPFNYVKIREREKKQKQIIDFIDKSKFVFLFLHFLSVLFIHYCLSFILPNTF